MIKKIQNIKFLLVFLLFLPIFVQAQEANIIVNPSIIDEQAKLKDLFEYKITIQNKGEFKADIYPLVNDLSSVEGRLEFLDPSKLKKSTSLARWISFSRGVIELMPGEEKTISLKIDISNNAIPGKRHASIAFPLGSNRKIAEEGMAKKSYAQLIINMEIVEDVVEKAQISEFKPSGNIFFSLPIDFILKISNNGNKPLSPRGNMYIYNRRGEEVASISANENSEAISPGEVWETGLKWTEAKGLGKYKARLDMEYGRKEIRDLQDTVYFWLLPWKLLLFFILLVFILLIFAVTLIFRMTFHPQHQHHKPPSKQGQEKSVEVLNLKK